WHRIQFGDIYGYVSKFDTTPSTKSAIKNLNEGYKNTSRTFETLKDVTVYDNSSGSIVPFAQLDKGTNFTIAADYGSWWRVLFADRVGYVKKGEVKAKFQKRDQHFRVYTDNLPVYDNRGSGPLQKIGELKKGQSYSIVSDYGNWWRVQFGDTYGYVSKASTGYATESEIHNLNKSYTNSSEKFATKNKVTVYDNSSGSLVVMGNIDKGMIFPIAGDYGDWWRIIYLDRVGYVNKDQVELYGIKRTAYDMTLNEVLEIQMKVSPQTDSSYAYVSQSYIDKNNKVTASALNVRSGPGAGNKIVGQLINGAEVNILGSHNGWYQIEFNHRQWVDASRSDALYYLDPNNFVDNPKQQFQFLDLSKSSDASVTELNKYLSGKGILSGQGKAFKDASKIYGINEVYLMSHALLETGHGSSTLAQGVKYNGVTVYNMYGIGANDHCPVECGAKRAYEKGWTTPYKAIVGGAAFISDDYIQEGQNTLYKMRWNPEGMDRYGYATHQYATDIGWASKQVYTMYNLYQDLGLTSVYLDIPVYKL
ncbi:SH3 domain-containing protein, partial [Oceanobacillus picturae]|uniref:SH3 domain-containing protein n=1 Tax=Oceanobacillus picturae TaxID=171693 RepID=UPI000AB6A5BE